MVVANAASDPGPLDRATAGGEDALPEFWGEPPLVELVNGGHHPIAPEVLADFIGRVGSTGNLVVGRRTHDMVTALGAASPLAETGAELVSVRSLSSTIAQLNYRVRH